MRFLNMMLPGFGALYQGSVLAWFMTGCRRFWGVHLHRLFLMVWELYIICPDKWNVIRLKPTVDSPITIPCHRLQKATIITIVMRVFIPQFGR